MATSFEVTGLDQLEAAFDALALSLQPNVRNAALQDGAERVLDRMQQLAPVDTGDLRDDLQIAPSPDGEGLEIGPGDSTGWRAHFTEFGTINQAAQPFMRPAFEMEQDAIRKGIRRHLAASIGATLARAR